MLRPALLLIAPAAGLLVALVWGGPKDITPLASINQPFATVAFSQVRPAQHDTARDGGTPAWYGCHFAGSTRQTLFGRYLLLSPFVHQDAPTSRPGTGGWASIGLPRCVALTLLSKAGLTPWNHLPVLNCTLDKAVRSVAQACGA
jgi:hypothetical protein